MSINAAFRSSKHNEAYVFVKERYVLFSYDLGVKYGPTLDGSFPMLARTSFENVFFSYDPGVRIGEILEGPKLIRDGFPVLARTPFENGMDCAFDTDGNQAYIFHRGDCALIDYAPHNSKNARFLIGQVPIGAMFPCLKNTTYEYGIDAAIRSSRSNEVYIFKGDQYARINYATKQFLNGTSIRSAWSSLANTCFANGLDSAFATHVKDEAYIFKGDHYARLNFSPCKDNDHIIGLGVQPILKYWAALRGIIALGQKPGGHKYWVALRSILAISNNE